ncbi:MULTISPECIES: hypothetical protein [Pseudoalteromonas]|nr:MULTISPECIES: hypothetical protein [Pseudoalteromonas]GAP76602.1 hypothetical protein W04_3163 [Pseudoalteromonas sp. SW0106-04]|tara:strand:- start:6739 stop:6861 length:123 start_codon:yes stop_codon:yes gene_type:complete
MNTSKNDRQQPKVLLLAVFLSHDLSIKPCVRPQAKDQIGA